ncbi:hypothetical protein [Butyrivibrio sp. AD3002]|uniref:hypothetical protein n=1 Tax=Butyrivibrio sp. AD3002 TaxID=1280670 RepID=UPI0012DCB16F|nr:hypothetical protein [Butyrivibrio sp. AD3002]
MKNTLAIIIAGCMASIIIVASAATLLAYACAPASTPEIIAEATEINDWSGYSHKI